MVHHHQQIEVLIAIVDFVLSIKIKKDHNGWTLEVQERDLPATTLLVAQTLSFELIAWHQEP
jgi:hypothetical protein